MNTRDIPCSAPPSAVDLEEVIMASIMLEPERLYDVLDILTPEMFYKDIHATIYAFMVKTQSSGKDYGYISVGRFLTELKSEYNAVWLSEITSKIVSTAMIEQHAMIVKEKYILREYLNLFYRGVNMITEGDDFSDISEYAGKEILRLSCTMEKKEPQQIGGIVDKVIDQVGKIQSKEIVLVGAPSGFTELDRITGGWKSKELIIVAARPSMGKTALALQFALNSAQLGYPVCFFSLEMGDMEIARRCLSSATGMTNTQLITGNCMSVDGMLSLTSSMVKAPLFVDDTSSLSLMEIRAKARKMVLKYGVKVFVVDYIGLMGGTKGRNQSREQEVSEFSRGLKSIAKDMDVSIIALSQLNRECESRIDKRPRLSDLRDSGAIEQDADVVLLLSRPAYYNINTISSPDYGDISSSGLMIVDIAKNRNGATGEIFLEHNKSITNICDYGYMAGVGSCDAHTMNPNVAF